MKLECDMKMTSAVLTDEVRSFLDAAFGKKRRMTDDEAMRLAHHVAGWLSGRIVASSHLYSHLAPLKQDLEEIASNWTYGGHKP